MRQRRRADQQRMQPDQEHDIEHHAEDDGDHVVARPPGPGHANQARRLTPLQRDAVVNGISQERAEQDDRGKIAVGDQMGQGPGLDRDEKRDASASP